MYIIFCCKNRKLSTSSVYSYKVVIIANNNKKPLLFYVFLIFCAKNLTVESIKWQINS